MKVLSVKNNPNGSLFARLHPFTAKQLYLDALQRAQNSNNEKRARNSNGKSSALGEWNVLHQKTDGEVVFLPLKIHFQNESVYASFNGGHIADENAIEMHPSLLPSIQTGDEVEVQALTNIPNAASVEVEPLGVSEWEMIDCCSEYLQQGGFLDQISVVYPNQTLPLKLPTKDVVGVKVLPMGEECVRVVRDTLLVVGPKPRADEGNMPSGPLRLVPVFPDDIPPSLHEFKASLPRSPPPFSVCIHPYTLQDIPGYFDGTALALAWLHSEDLDDSLNVAVIRIIASDDIPMRHAAMHRDVRLQIHATPLYQSIHVQLLTQEQIMTASVSSPVFLKVSPLHVHFDANAFQQEFSPWLFPLRYTLDFGYSKPSNMTRGEVASYLISWLESLPLHEDSIIPITTNTIISLPIQNDTTMQLCLSLSSIHSSEPDFDRNLTRSSQTHCPFFINANLLKSLLSCPQSPLSFSTKHQTMPLPTFEPFLFLQPQTTSKPSQHFRPCNALLLCGEQGTGKTHLALTIASALRFSFFRNTLYLNCKHLQTSLPHMHQILEEITSYMKKCFRIRPCLLILDDVDSLVPNLCSSSRDAGSVLEETVSPALLSQVKLITDHILHLMDEIREEDSVKLLATCRNRSAIHENFEKYFHRCMEVPRLHSRHKPQVFDLMMKEHWKRYAAPCQVEHLLPNFRALTEGYRPYDLFALSADVARRAMLRQFQTNSPQKLTKEDVVSAMGGYTPIAYQDADLCQSKTQWEDIGGFTEVKRQLMEHLIHPVQYAKIYQSAPITLPRGILLYGPSGCGKSYLVPALANHLHLNLITIHGPSILNRYIGASESKIRQIFQTAAATSPSLLFFDNFEALCPQRGTDHTGVTDRIVNQLLTFLDGVGAMEGTVYVMAATSSPQNVDTAILRPGRLDTHVYVGFPETEGERGDIFKCLAKGMPFSPEAEDAVRTGRVLENVPHLDLFTPADFKAVLDTAYLLAAQDCLVDGNGEEVVQDLNVVVDEDHIFNALLQTKPSISRKERLSLMELYESFRGRPRSRGENKDPHNLRVALR